MELAVYVPKKKIYNQDGSFIMKECEKANLDFLKKILLKDVLSQDFLVFLKSIINSDSNKCKTNSTITNNTYALIFEYHNDNSAFRKFRKHTIVYSIIFDGNNYFSGTNTFNEVEWDCFCDFLNTLF